MIALIYEASYETTFWRKLGRLMNRKEVIIVEDHRMVSQALAHVLEEAGYRTRIFNNSGLFKQAIPTINNEKSVVLIDLNLQNTSNLELIPDLIKNEIPILAMSLHSELFFVSKLLDMGVYAYISKEESLECLTDAIQKVLQGQKFLSSMLKDRLIFNKQTQTFKLS